MRGEGRKNTCWAGCIGLTRGRKADTRTRLSAEICIAITKAGLTLKTWAVVSLPSVPVAVLYWIFVYTSAFLLRKELRITSRKTSVFNFDFKFPAGLFISHCSVPWLNPKLFVVRLGQHEYCPPYVITGWVKTSGLPRCPRENMYESTWAVFYGKIIWKYSSPARYYPIQSILQTKRASVFSHMSGPSLRVLMVRYACATATLEHAVVRQILEDRQDVRSHKLTSIAKHTNPAALLLNTSSINKPFVFVLSYIGLRTPTTTAAAAAAAAAGAARKTTTRTTTTTKLCRPEGAVSLRWPFCKIVGEGLKACSFRPLETLEWKLLIGKTWAPKDKGNDLDRDCS